MIAIMEIVLGLLSGISDPIAKAFGEWMQSNLSFQSPSYWNAHSRFGHSLH